MVWKELEKIRRQREREEQRRKWEFAEKLIQFFNEIYPIPKIKDILIENAKKKYVGEKIEIYYKTSSKNKENKISLLYDNENQPFLYIPYEDLNYFSNGNLEYYIESTKEYKKIKKALKMDFRIIINKDNADEGFLEVEFYKLYKYLF
jgi:hypothetical protein